MSETNLARSDQPFKKKIVNLVALERGLYAFEIGERPCLLGQMSGLQVPAVHAGPATGGAARRRGSARG